MSTVFNHLYNKYKTRGNLEFTFVTKNLAREMKLGSYEISGALRMMRDRDLVIVSRKRRVRNIWKTNFNGKGESIEPL